MASHRDFLHARGVFLDLKKEVNKYTAYHHFKDGNPHISPYVLILDGYASRVTSHVLSLATVYNMDLFQLQSHSFRMTRSPHVRAFGALKLDFIDVGTWKNPRGERQQDGKIPPKSEITDAEREVGAPYLATQSNKVPCEGTGNASSTWKARPTD